jgi:(1->4)-alpha-D-glucan 1-alpha-D-glucosylmutase
MNTTATHDTKRGEDARARLNVLSELPDEWNRMLQEWRGANRRAKMKVRGQAAPDRNDEYFLYQSLIAFWPFFDSERADFLERLKQYVIKAIREAKMRTAWLKPDAEYEEAYLRFVDRILADDSEFLESFVPFQRRVTWYGMVNSLGQVLLKLTCPGVPDIYRGCELWDLSMVDPDNRRPVDFRQRIQLLTEIKKRIESDRMRLLRELINDMSDGCIKLYLTHIGLSARREHRELFQRGEYLPLEVDGSRGEHLLAFARRDDDRTAITIVPRLSVDLAGENQLPLGKEVWEDTSIPVPDKRAAWMDTLTGRSHSAEERLYAGDVLTDFPVALLISETK